MFPVSFNEWKESTGSTSFSRYRREMSLLLEGEKDFPPSVVEPCNYIPLEQLVKDYSRGIVHKERERAAFFDDSLVVTGADPGKFDDLTDIFGQSPFEPKPAKRAEAKQQQPEKGSAAANEPIEPEGEKGE